MPKIRTILLVVEDGEDHALVIMAGLDEKLKVKVTKEIATVELRGIYPGANFVPLDEIAKQIKLRNLNQMVQMVRLREKIIRAAIANTQGANKDEGSTDQPDTTDSAGSSGT